MARTQARHGLTAAVAMLALLVSAPGAWAQTDTTAPETTITEGPAEGSTINTDAPQFGWSSSEAPATFRCTADGEMLSSCEQAFLTGAVDGPHSFSVAATDAAGNTDPTPATRTFTVRLSGVQSSQGACPLDGNQIVGTNARDTRSGTPGTDIIFGLRGNDVLRGGSGADCVAGQAGNDRVFGGPGSDFVFGGTGNDRIGGDSGDDDLRGDSGSDRITGSSGRDRLDGGAGRDHLSDFSGRDSFRGGPGSDLIEARDQFDRRTPDDVRCGSGRDVAVVDALDRVAADCERVRRRA